MFSRFEAMIFVHCNNWCSSLLDQLIQSVLNLTHLFVHFAHLIAHFLVQVTNLVVYLDFDISHLFIKANHFFVQVTNLVVYFFSVSPDFILGRFDMLDEAECSSSVGSFLRVYTIILFFILVVFNRLNYEQISILFISNFLESF